MKRLLLVRHGESHWNVEGRIQGQRCSGLSPRGRDQADALAAAYRGRLAELLAAGVGTVRVVSSDLQRARETAAPLAAALGLEVGVDARLRERAFGSWEGRSHRELAVEEPQRWQRWTAGADVMTEIGAETAEQLADRVAPALEELHAATPDGGTCVVVSHGGSIWHGLHRLLGLRSRSLGPVGNASVAELLLLVDEDGSVVPDEGTTGGNGAADGAADGADPGAVRPILASYNDLAHLPVELRTGGFVTGTTSDAVPQMR